MTTKSVRQILWRFVIATFALVGAFVVFYSAVTIIIQHSMGDAGPMSLRAVLLLIPFMIVAAVYTWLKWKKLS
jgi:hypothetical protein